MAEHFDVVIVGAGLSGIGAACHLKMLCPDRSFTILEGRPQIGGTWDLFRYPGIRSDSDMHTLGYSFKPWTHEKSIADGASILEYLHETVDEFDLTPHIRFGHHVEQAAWSSETATWTLHTERGDDDEAVDITCSMLLMCSGYYSYSHGYTPDFPHIERFEGRIVHPQQWPDDLDVAGQHVVVIGSGATAMTLVPAIADRAAHVTMLQRSPTYVVALPDRDVLANRLRRWLPDRLAYRITRRKNIALTQWFYERTRSKPEKVKQRLLKMVRERLGDDITTQHFTPSYHPWDQRLCVIPNGDLYGAIRSGSVSVVTDRIDSFTEHGIRLASGHELEADVVVTATGLRMVTLGEMSFEVDGEPVDFSKRFTYKGVAYSGVPNLISTFGYINASWTLRADLIAQFACRVLQHMRRTGTHQFTPRLRDSDLGMPERPWIADFTPGYMNRMMPMLPRQGDRAPWTNPQRYKADQRALLHDPIEDGVLQFTTPARTAVSAQTT